MKLVGSYTMVARVSIPIFEDDKSVFIVSASCRRFLAFVFTLVG